MPWLIAFITAHAIQIAAIGGVLTAISSAESVVVNGIAIEKAVTNKDVKKE